MTARWTWMVFMAADNDLSGAAERDLAEMRGVGSSDALHIAVEVDSSGTAPSRRFRVEAGGQGEEPELLGETDSGSPEALLSFVRWAAETCPAERYALVLWSHGDGWAPGEVDGIAAEEGAGLEAEEGGRLAERLSGGVGRTFFRSSVREIVRLPPAERRICCDDGSGRSLDAVELGRVLEGAAGILGRPLDLLGMDACLMSNLEVAYQVRRHARTLVASLDEAPADGWPYEAVLRRLRAEPGLSTREAAAHVTASYAGAYLNGGVARPAGVGITQAALDLERLEGLTAPLDALCDRLLALMEGGGGREAAALLWGAQRMLRPFAGAPEGAAAQAGQGFLYDLGELAEALALRARPAGLEAVAEAAGAVREALAPAEDRGGGCVIAAENHGRRVRRASGVSIYLPRMGQHISRYYRDLEFSMNHRWRPMIEAYRRLVGQAV